MCGKSRLWTTQAAMRLRNTIFGHGVDLQELLGLLVLIHTMISINLAKSGHSLLLPNAASDDTIPRARL